MGAIKDRYLADLQHTYPTWVYVETAVGDSTNVEAYDTTAVTINSVSDVGGNASFNFTPGPTLAVGNEITIANFAVEVEYNGVWIITATSAAEFEGGFAYQGTEASVSSFTQWMYSITKPVVDDCYKAMREDLIGFLTDEASPQVVDTVQTTDATLTTISTIPIPDDTTELVEATLIGIKSDGTDRATYKAIQSVYRASAGSATLISTETVIHAVESDVSWTGLSFSVSGNNLLVEATGRLATTIDWQCTAVIQKFT